MNPLYVRLSPGWPDRSSDAPVVLLLHGLGSNEDDLPSLAPYLPRGLPWVSLRAPLEMNFGGASWFPLDLPNEPEQAGIDAATGAIWAWVDANIPPDARVIPLGFSQGGLMALQLLRTRPERIAATVVLSGLIADDPQPAGGVPTYAAPFNDAALAESRPRVFWGRGEADAVIWPEAIARLGAWLGEHATATIRVYPGLAHGVNGDEMNDVKAFLRATV